MCKTTLGVGGWGGESRHVLKIRAAGHTGGVSRVNNTENTRVAVLPGFRDGPLQLCNIQTPAVVLVQVVVDLHGPQVSQGGRVQRVLGDGDQDPGSAPALPSHQQLQNGLEQTDKWSQGYQETQEISGPTSSMCFQNTPMEMINQSYHYGVAGPGGEVYVVRVGGYPTVPSLYVARHVLADALDALAGTVGPWKTRRRTWV